MSNILNLAKSALTYVTTLHHSEINQKIMEGKYFPVGNFQNFSKVADQLFRRKQSTKFGVFSKCQNLDITLVSSKLNGVFLEHHDEGSGIVPQGTFQFESKI